MAKTTDDDLFTECFCATVCSLSYEFCLCRVPLSDAGDIHFCGIWQNRVGLMKAARKFVEKTQEVGK